ncbi:MAG: type II secretion system F family protein [Paludisphaera borealis]|uniref:type II secretion system F family protein n=1 Tax=Paludisphaera borealis TaxID=1387353 RepID=UPI00284B56D8|nr:type II secretion system F family protein [Paludisphaera borealis]MDR3617793.1 type II secretion system F family protein [Paludisphaera borealis]
MSHDPEDAAPLEPRRPRRPPQGDDEPPQHPARAGFGESTFQPAPGRSGSAGSKPRPKPKPSGDAPSSRPAGVREVVEAGPKWYERILFGRVSSGQLAQFCRQFGAYLQAGVDFNRALSSLEQQFERTALGPVIGRMRTNIKAGSTLEEAMSRDKRVFGTMFLSMIRVAEARGGVPETLKLLSRHYESRQRLIRQARSAMIYPIIVLTLAGGVVALITIFLLPMFASLLSDISRKAQLPWASRALLAFSGFISAGGWWLFPLVLIGVPVFLFQVYKAPAGKAILDRVILRLPVFGSLCRKLDTSRFARTLATLLDAGVDVGSSMDLTAQVVSMTPIRNAVLAAKDQVMQGKDLSAALRPSRQFNHDVYAVLESGEETGKIPESLNHLADDYEEQVTHMVKNMGELIQPLLILMLGGLVLFIILAVMMPYIQILTSLSGG